MNTEYHLKLSEEFVADAFVRYRAQLRWYLALQALKTVVGVIVGILGAFAFYKGAIVFGTIILAVVLVLVFSSRIDVWIARRRFRNSPRFNDEVVFSISDQGAQLVGRTFESRFDWSNITKARRFRDGLLLVHGPQSFNWLPDSSAKPVDVASAQGIIEKHIRDYREV